MMNASSFDDIVIGAGIIGLAHAYALGKRGRRVALVERNPRAVGASIRNFGMVWPIGQPDGARHDLAIRSRGLWLELLTDAGIWHDPVGSLHVSYHELESAVLEEYSGGDTACATERSMLTARQAVERSPRLVPDGLLGALWSPTEVCVDPREVVATVPGYLAERFNVALHFSTSALAVADGVVTTNRGELRAERVWVCCGDDLTTLFAGGLANTELRACKLQMMRTTPLEGGERIGPMLAAGLTLRHYKSFASCPSLPALIESLDERYPGYEDVGIHVMASQNGNHELVLGDSHEYDDDIEVFDKEHIDQMVLDYLRSFLSLEGTQIAQRWHGIYVKHRTKPWVNVEPDANTLVTTGLGGAGMTLSFGLAEQQVSERIR